jgi:hypothetical protein
MDVYTVVLLLFVLGLLGLASALWWWAQVIARDIVVGIPPIRRALLDLERVAQGGAGPQRPAEDVPQPR